MACLYSCNQFSRSSNKSIEKCNFLLRSWSFVHFLHISWGLSLLSLEMWRGKKDICIPFLNSSLKSVFINLQFFLVYFLFSLIGMYQDNHWFNVHLLLLQPCEWVEHSIGTFWTFFRNNSIEICFFSGKCTKHLHGQQ